MNERAPGEHVHLFRARCKGDGVWFDQCADDDCGERRAHVHGYHPTGRTNRFGVEMQCTERPNNCGTLITVPDGGAGTDA